MSPPPQFVCVIYADGQWQYDTNGAYVAFTPNSATDLLVATLDYSANTATSSQGENENVGSPPIHLGYASGDVAVTAQQWGGSENDGEFSVTGSIMSGR